MQGGIKVQRTGTADDERNKVPCPLSYEDDDVTYSCCRKENDEEDVPAQVGIVAVQLEAALEGSSFGHCRGPLWSARAACPVRYSGDAMWSRIRDRKVDAL